MTSGTESVVLFIKHNILVAVAAFARAYAIYGSAAGLVSFLEVLNFSDHIQFFGYVKSNPISQSIKSKLKDP